MMDLEIFKGPRWMSSNFLDTKIFQKPTKIGAPLGHDSYHHPSIHRWPIERIKHFRILSTDSKAYREFSKNYMKWLAANSPGHPALDEFRRILYNRRHVSRCSERKYVPEHWIPIRYHEIWHRAGLFGLARDLFAEWKDYLPGNVRPFFCVSFAWCLSGPHLQNEICEL